MKGFDELQQRTWAFINDGRCGEAAAILEPLTGEGKDTYCFACFLLAQVENARGNPRLAEELYYKAFDACPDGRAGAVFFEKTHPEYVYKGRHDHARREDCPLCGKKAAPRWAYATPHSASYNNRHNPVRVWMHCADCNHCFAESLPETLYDVSGGGRPMQMKGYGPFHSKVLNKCLTYIREVRGEAAPLLADGLPLLEIGIGASELLLAAREMGFDAKGLDIIPANVKQARRFGLNAETADFMEYDDGSRYDLIIMGDVIEHVPNPIEAMKKAAGLLAEKGLLWVSTPNFENYWSLLLGHKDVMKLECGHVNYFSRESFYKLLDMCGLSPLEYAISEHYRGSMEIISVKK
ncbi:MAG: class I SAM-dependent methyltransferase [Clostridiales bacterium]|jgi:SAM-dependent methyltransferase|nr:class I SAM-dependent methyltransferase [Clostridiales bacterium]